MTTAFVFPEYFYRSKHAPKHTTLQELYRCGDWRIVLTTYEPAPFALLKDGVVLARNSAITGLRRTAKAMGFEGEWENCE